MRPQIDFSLIKVGPWLLCLFLGTWAVGASAEGEMTTVGSASGVVRPAIDRATPTKTERAVFALG